MAQKVEDLQVWQRARELEVAVTAITDRASFQRDLKLRDQIRDATDSVISNISEGFEQPSDRAFARYLYISKSSNAEARTRLGTACRKAHISRTEFETCDEIADHIARMLTGLIKYLLRSDRKRRGLGRDWGPEPGQG